MKSDRLLEDEQLGTQGFQKTVYQTLYLAYKPYYKKIAITIAAGFFGRLLLLANANVIGWWVDGKLPMEAEQIIILLTVLAVVGALFTLLFRVLFSRLSAKAVSQIYDEVSLRTSRFPMSFFDTTPAGRIVTRFSSDYGNVFRLFGGPLAEFISIIYDLVAMLILITLASPLFLLFVFVVGVLNFLVYKKNRDKLRVLRRDLSASRSPSIAHFAETTQGASTIRSFRRTKEFQNRFIELDGFFIGKKKATVKGLLWFSFQMNSLSAFLLLATGLSSILFINWGWTTIGAVGVAFAFIVMSANSIQMFFEWLAQFEEAMIGVERLDQYLRAPIEEGSLLPSIATFETKHPVYSSSEEQNSNLSKLTSDWSTSIEVSDLWFRYHSELPWVLKGISFDVKAGERLGIIGRTGSGKSSLIQALFRLYPVTKGSIKIGGHSPKMNSESHGIDLKIYRRAMAFISQEPVLFLGTLRMNLDILRNHTDEECFAALDRVGLGEWARQHPQKLNLKIEERGKNLSLGERQLLCMARCLLQDAPVVIMDEATSAVDPQSEEILVRATEEFFNGKTQIIIAHRLTTLLRCDRVLWLDNGEIKSIGPTAKVLAEFESNSESAPSF